MMKKILDRNVPICLLLNLGHIVGMVQVGAELSVLITADLILEILENRTSVGKTVTCA